VDWGISLNDSHYAIKNALIYSLLISLILLAPLYIYFLYSKTLFEIQNEIELKAHANLVVQAMETFDPKNEPYFEFPRFKRIESGLYNVHLKPIFTLITHPLSQTQEGYHLNEGYAYYVQPLPKNRYFGAEYLIIGNQLSLAPVYEKVAIILLLIAIVIFLLSLYFLNRFARPFMRLNARLDRFIKDSMHEINTPLSIINVNIDLHNRKHEPSKYLQRIKAAAKTLSTIYDDMDYLIKNQRIEFTPEIIDLGAFLKERVVYFEEVAAMKMIRLHVTHCERVQIRFNPTQLQRLIDNNISNAIKYSRPESTVELSLTCNENGCDMSFRDYGIGMKNPDQIFERYYRESKKVGGFGIGLNIVKSIMDQYEITLTLDSVYGKGSCFTYHFPKKPCIIA
jgi:two-component system, OmpR family, sensor kinase